MRTYSWKSKSSETPAGGKRTRIVDSNFHDRRDSAVAQRSLMEMARDSERALQRKENDKASDQDDEKGTDAGGLISMMPAVTVQRQTGGGAEGGGGAAEHRNDTGLPDGLKSGIESLSGMSMDHVKVHYSSDKPAQLNAHAYAQGRDIHIAPGQEQHLPHEAWHVVQQAQGRVAPTMQAKGVSINDDHALEHEADVMGARALQAKPEHGNSSFGDRRVVGIAQMAGVIQAIRGTVATAQGERVNLVNRHDGTFLDRKTGRIFTQDLNNPAIFHLQADDVLPIDQGIEQDGEEEEGGMEQDGADMEEEEPQGPLRAAFLNARHAIEQHLGRGLTGQEWDVIADHAADAINNMRTYGLNPVTELSGPNGASCIPTSDWIYSLLRHGPQTQRGNAGDTTTTAERLDALATAIENEAANSIYQVVFNPAHHGFVVVIVGDLAEVTQSFANSESLGTNLENENFTFTRAQVAAHLRNFLDNDETAEAQEAMFEGRIDGGEDEETYLPIHPIAQMQLSWNRSSLRADAATAIQGELNTRANALFPRVHGQR
ncbi:DUF4157 domain-containing protein [Herbaspirillum chlorophenolicum]|uniref:DUF4157 domain-containing protein n=1 Tax=Herbaspirillum chlorophenolicum TaxID=211589 RepID=A0ABW8F3N7_9BURK